MHYVIAIKAFYRQTKNSKRLISRCSKIFHAIRF